MYNVVWYRVIPYCVNNNAMLYVHKTLHDDSLNTIVSNNIVLYIACHTSKMTAPNSEDGARTINSCEGAITICRSTDTSLSVTVVGAAAVQVSARLGLISGSRAGAAEVVVLVVVSGGRI